MARVNVLLLLVPAAVLTVLGLVMVHVGRLGLGDAGLRRQPLLVLPASGHLRDRGRGGAADRGAAAAHGLAEARGADARWSSCRSCWSRCTSAGTSLYGASRWIDLGPVTLQPSELMKLAMVAFAATVLTKKWGKLDDPVHLLIPLAPVVVIVAVLVILQRDLGTTIVICGSVIVLLFVAGVRCGTWR